MLFRELLCIVPGGALFIFEVEQKSAFTSYPSGTELF